MFYLSKNLCICNYKVLHRRCVDVCCCPLSQHDIWMGNCSTVVPNFVETYVNVKWRRERRSKCRHQQQQPRTIKKDNLSILSGGILLIIWSTIIGDHYWYNLFDAAKMCSQDDEQGSKFVTETYTDDRVVECRSIVTKKPKKATNLHTGYGTPIKTYKQTDKEKDASAACWLLHH